MSELIEQVRTSFETPKGVETGSPVTVMSCLGCRRDSLASTR